MKTIVSKELLSEVLKIDDICGIKIEEDKWVCILYYYGRDICEEVINIYELAHKCKEWAFKQGYELFSRILSNDNQMSGNCLVIRVESDPETVLTITNAETEPEAIFKACGWILENK